MKLLTNIFIFLFFILLLWNCKKADNKESKIDYQEKFCGNWSFTTMAGVFIGYWDPYETRYFNGTITKNPSSDSIIDIHYDSISPKSDKMISPKVNTNGSLSLTISSGFFQGQIDVPHINMDLVYYLSHGYYYSSTITGNKIKKLCR